MRGEVGDAFPAMAAVGVAAGQGCHHRLRERRGAARVRGARPRTRGVGGELSRILIPAVGRSVACGLCKNRDDGRGGGRKRGGATGDPLPPSRPLMAPKLETTDRSSAAECPGAARGAQRRWRARSCSRPGASAATPLPVATWMVDSRRTSASRAACPATRRTARSAAARGAPHAAPAVPGAARRRRGRSTCKPAGVVGRDARTQRRAGEHHARRVARRRARRVSPTTTRRGRRRRRRTSAAAAATTKPDGPRRRAAEGARGAQRHGVDRRRRRGARATRHGAADARHRHLVGAWGRSDAMAAHGRRHRHRRGRPVPPQTAACTAAAAAPRRRVAWRPRRRRVDGTNRPGRNASVGVKQAGSRPPRNDLNEPACMLDPQVAPPPVRPTQPVSRPYRPKIDRSGAPGAPGATPGGARQCNVNARRPTTLIRFSARCRRDPPRPVSPLLPPTGAARGWGRSSPRGGVPSAARLSPATARLSPAAARLSPAAAACSRYTAGRRCACLLTDRQGRVCRYCQNMARARRLVR